MEIPNSVTTIGGDAFGGCYSLTSVMIPNSVTSIGHGAFSYCTGLASVVIGNSVTSIGDYAFEYCPSLISVDIPNSVTSIGGNVFGKCPNLTFFTGKFATKDNRCLIVDGILKAFAPAGLTSYEIPNSVIAIDDYTFYEYSNLESVVIPNSVISIGNYAFGGCSCLKKITSLAVTPPSIDYSTFCNVPNEEGVLIVPDESVEAYKSAENWKYFFNIVGITSAGISAPSANDSHNNGKAYNLNGMEANEGYKGIVIMNGKKMMRK